LLEIVLARFWGLTGFIFKASFFFLSYGFIFLFIRKVFYFWETSIKIVLIFSVSIINLFIIYFLLYI
jgi:hypothetical protein